MRLVLAVLLILTSPLALAIQVQGEGSSFEEAKQSAFKVAIDQEVGVILDTERHLKNGKIVHNQILSYSAGYIISSSLIHHVIIRDRNLHQVTFDVTVASSLLKDFVLSSNHNTKSFNIDDIKAQTQSSKETHKDGMDLLDSTLKFFPNKAFNIEMHDFSVIVNYHDPRKFHLHVPYTLSWNQKYLVALQEALTLFKADRAFPTFVQFNDEVIFITDSILMRNLNKTFRGDGNREFILLSINSLHDTISINSCVQNIKAKLDEPYKRTKSLYSHPGRGIKFMTDRSVDSFILFDLEEKDLERISGSTELTLTVVAAENCPENT